jgi:hypothetical protein
MDVTLQSELIAIAGAAVAAILGFGVRWLRGRALDKAAAILQAVAPVIVGAIERYKQMYVYSHEGKPMTGELAKAQAMEAARAAVPAIAKVLAPSLVTKMASEAIEKQVPWAEDNIKRMKGLSVHASTDGKEIGAEIKAELKRGAIKVHGSNKGGGIGAAFRF